MKIVLVSSHNGLGHASRLYKLKTLLWQSEHRVVLITGAQQFAVFHREFGAANDIICLEEMLADWVDGPHVKTPIVASLGEKSASAVSFICDADLVISDNVLWPIDFNPNTIVYSHFLWLSYYQANSLSLPEVEESRLIKLRALIGPKDFEVPLGDSTHTSRVGLLLPRFDEHHDLSSRTPRSEIWITRGITGTNADKVLIHETSKIKVVERETFFLSRTQEPPLAFAGRPGMASIGEALSAGIPFIPLFSGLDFELFQNAKNLEKIGCSREFDGYNSLNIHTLQKYLEGLRDNAQTYRQTRMMPAEDWAMSIIATNLL